MKYRLLVLDIDGKVILRLEEKGVRVAIASGRHPRGVLSIAEVLNFHQSGNFILAFNGATCQPVPYFSVSHRISQSSSCLIS